MDSEDEERQRVFYSQIRESIVSFEALLTRLLSLATATFAKALTLISAPLLLSFVDIPTTTGGAVFGLLLASGAI